MRGYKRSPLDAHAAVLVSLVAEQPELMVDEIRAAWQCRGIRTGRGSVWRFFKRHGISFKKNRARHGAEPTGRGDSASKVAAPLTVV